MIRVSQIVRRKCAEYDYAYYQNYYELALRNAFPKAKFKGFPSRSSLIRRIARKFSLSQSGEATGFPVTVNPHCGQYQFIANERPIKVAIDAHDAPAIVDSQAMEWADVYLKSNYWPQYPEYSKKVRPIVNGNGDLTPAKIQSLIGKRETAKEYDLVFISRIWGGIEHNCRVFEALLDLPGKVNLLAVFPEYPGEYGEQLQQARRRLEEAGVPCTSDLVPSDDLWSMLARSRVVLMRAGKHLCLPWRTIDLLAMGAAIVLESAPRPQWPVPLQEGVHYLSAGLQRPDNTDPAPAEQYAAIRETIQRVLEDAELQRNLSAHAATYFDEQASPHAVGKYMAKVLNLV